MGDAPRKRSRRVREAAKSGGAWKDVATALLPVTACFLGGATEKWAEGIVVALVGALLLANPPRRSLGGWFNAAAVGVVICAAVAFLPAAWFATPGWRIALLNDFNLALPATLSPQPWLTAGCLASFIAGLAWLYYVSAQELENSNARRQLRVFAGGVIALAALSVALFVAKTPLPFWHNQRGFGPFPNRNQTADLLGITSVVIIACGQEEIRRGRKWWLFWLLGLAVAIAAIVLNFSRAGVAILVVGSVLWVGVVVLRGGSGARIAVGASALLAVLTAILLFGGKTLERFNFRGGDGAGVTSDFRWLIFRDALELIRSSPWPGIGLGNFQPVFAIFRQASVGQNRALHPESDWLWLAAEVGWPGVILVLVGAALLVWRVFPLAEGTNMRLRLAAFVGALLFGLHGLIDVSGHRVGSAYAGLLLLGLALRRPAADNATVVLPMFFRAVGVLLIALGGVWASAALRGVSVPGSIGVDLEKQFAAEANKRRAFSETIAHTTRGLEWAPLEWQLYFLRAIGKVGAGRPPNDAVDDFRRARFLEPSSYEVPYQEGLTWITREPVLAITAWREALRRAGTERPELYSRMLSIASQYRSPVERMLQEFGSVQPDLALTFLERARGETFTRAVERLLDHEPSLATLSAAQKTKLFEFWMERGDLAKLDELVSENPNLLEFAWRGVAQHRAAREDFRGAYEIAQRFGGSPKVPVVSSDDSIEQLRQKVYASSNNYEAALALYLKQKDSAAFDDALITLRRFTQQAGTPAYFHFLEAQSWGAKENWDRAWSAWQNYERATRTSKD